jgi:probable HAF family extracellular repeat protein
VLRRLALHAVIVGLLALMLAPLQVASAQSTAPRYSVVEIGTLPGFDSSTATGINASGRVVGTLQLLPYGQTSAFVWDSSTGLRALGTFTGRGTVGAGINDNGEVAGSAVGSVYNPGFAFRWSPTSGFERLDPPAGVYGSAGSDINDARQVAGSAQVSGPWAVRWGPTRQPRLLGSLGGNQGSADGINESGQVVGWTRNSLGYPRPFLWDPKTGMRDLGTFRGGRASVGVASAVNDSGHVAGDADTRNIGRAFLWRDGRLIAIGPELSYAHALNNADHVVGQFHANGTDRAFLYRDGTFSDLNTLIPSGSGIVLNDATGINDAGLIAANGTNPRGQQRGFVLVPR